MTTAYRIVPATDTETIGKLVRTLEVVNSAIKNPEILNKDLLDQYTDSKLSFKSKHVSKMLKKCLVSHRFTDAAKILECLSCETDSCHLIFKAGFQVLENHPNTTEETIPHFVRHIRHLPCLHKKEIILETVIYLIKHERFQEAHQQIQDLLSYRCLTNLRTDPLIDGLLSAYDGLLNYVQWALVKVDADFDDTGTAYNRELNMQKWADRAINLISNLIHQPGQWDIFIVKLVEILEYYERFDETEEALSKYAEMNPSHIHAHIYLYEFYKRHDYKMEMQHICLQRIVEMCPSDERVLDYVQIKIEENGIGECIEVMFDYLNFAENKNHLEAWNVFVELLLQVYKKCAKDEISKLKDTWNEYKSFWPAYQFSKLEVKINDANSAKLAMLKSIALCLLEDIETDHPYVEAVRKGLMSTDLDSDLELQFCHKINEVKFLKEKETTDDNTS